MLLVLNKFFTIKREILVMKKITILLFGLLLSNFSYAQFGNLMGAVSGGGSGVSAEKIVGGYINSSKLVISSQQKLLEAAQVKVDQDMYTAQIKNLTASATSEQIESSAKIQTDGSKQLQEVFSNKSLKLDAKGQKAFISGAAELGKGVLSYVKFFLDAKGFKPSPADLSSAGTALTVVKGVPDDVLAVKTSLSAVYDYAKSNNIPLPKDITDATKSLESAGF
jgi:hypothetical protein